MRFSALLTIVFATLIPSLTAQTATPPPAPAAATGTTAAAPASIPAAPIFTDTDWPSVPRDRLTVDVWAKRHAAILEAEKTKHPDLVFIGDSITQNWEAQGKRVETDYVSVFQHFYGDRNAMNLGIAGDTTANVLWRIDHGELDDIHPKVAVMLIGTNNNSRNRTTPAPRTAAGTEKIVAELHQKQPQMKILIIGILPKETTPDKLAIDRAVNFQVARDLAADKLVTCIDVGSIYYKADGTLDTDLFEDPKATPPRPALHPTAIGMRMEAEAIEPTLAKLLGDTPKQWP